jgi:signal transduction histidine kinase
MRRLDVWGLPGMRERSESIGAGLKVWSETNAGTEVEVRISARYRLRRTSDAHLQVDQTTLLLCRRRALTHLMML